MGVQVSARGGVGDVRSALWDARRAAVGWRMRKASIGVVFHVKAHALKVGAWSMSVVGCRHVIRQGIFFSRIARTHARTQQGGPPPNGSTASERTTIQNQNPRNRHSSTPLACHLHPSPSEGLQVMTSTSAVRLVSLSETDGWFAEAWGTASTDLTLTLRITWSSRYRPRGPRSAPLAASLHPPP